MAGKLLTPAELSAYLDVPVGTLQQWRHRKVGPPAIKVEGHVRYREREVEKYLDAQTKEVAA